MTPESEVQYISATDLRKYRTEIPNLYDDSDLDPYEFRLLVHYCRRGETWEAIRTTAKICQMSHPTVLQKRNSLALKGFIVLDRDDENNVVIRVQDKWLENFSKYSGRSVDNLWISGSQATKSGSVVSTDGSQATNDGSLVYLKKEPIKNKPKEEETLEEPRGGAGPIGEAGALRIFTAVTNFMAFPSRSMGDDIARIITVYNVKGDETVEYLQQFFDAWIERKYNKVNTSWLDWAITGEIPEKREKPKKRVEDMSDDEKANWFKEDAERWGIEH